MCQLPKRKLQKTSLHEVGCLSDRRIPWKEPWPVLLTESKRLGWVTKEGLGVAAGILHRLTEQVHRVQVHFNDSGIPWTTMDCICHRTTAHRRWSTADLGSNPNEQSCTNEETRSEVLFKMKKSDEHGSTNQKKHQEFTKANSLWWCCTVEIWYGLETRPISVIWYVMFLMM